jgi:acyl carrier protein
VVLDQQIKNIIVQTICGQAEDLTPQTRLGEDFGIDSLDLVELTMALEEQLLNDNPIEEAVAEEWRTVQDVIDTVNELAEKQKTTKGAKPAQGKGGR